MLHSVVVWLLVVAFFGAGLFNAIGTRATQDDFARWGYPRWWCRVTGGLEIVSAALIAHPAGRDAGVALGAIIIAVAFFLPFCPIWPWFSAAKDSEGFNRIGSCWKNESYPRVMPLRPIS